MKLPRYPLRSSENLLTFEFNSVGPKGSIAKLIQYSETNLKGVYNLAFGDKDLHTGQIDDNVISNNGDSEMVLATVVASVYAFTDLYPEAYVYATGSTLARSRLYRMGISKYLDEVEENFEIFGEFDGDWHPFERKVDYISFLVKRK